MALINIICLNLNGKEPSRKGTVMNKVTRHHILLSGRTSCLKWWECCQQTASWSQPHQRMSLLQINNAILEVHTSQDWSNQVIKPGHFDPIQNKSHGWSINALKLLLGYPRLSFRPAMQQLTVSLCPVLLLLLPSIGADFEDILKKIPNTLFCCVSPSAKFTRWSSNTQFLRGNCIWE